MRSWKTKRKDGGVFLFSMMLALLVVIGMPMKVQAEETRTEGTIYYIWNDKVTLKKDGTDVVSTGPVTVTKSGDTSTITLNANVLGCLWFMDGGNYVLNANHCAIYPKGLDQAIDYYFSRGNDSLALKLTGNGIYFAGDLRIIYNPGSNDTLEIESGMFVKESSDIWGNISNDYTFSKIGEAIYIVTKDNCSNEEQYKYDNSESLPTNINGSFLVKQEAPTTSELNYFGIKMLNPEESFVYAPTPTPDPVQPGDTPSNPGDNSNNQSGNNSSNPNGSGEGSTTPPISGDSSVGGYAGNGEEIVPVVIEVPAGQKYVENVLSQLDAVPEDGKVMINTEDWYCFNKTLAEKIADRKDVAVTITYKYQGKKYEVTIPAGSDIVSLLDENGFVGFRYLDAVFGGREITE